jgi:hypothetical protein
LAQLWEEWSALSRERPQPVSSQSGRLPAVPPQLLNVHSSDIRGKGPGPGRSKKPGDRAAICEKEKIKAVTNSTIAQAHVERVAHQAEAPEPSHENALERLSRCLASLRDPQSCISLVSEIWS